MSSNTSSVMSSPRVEKRSFSSTLKSFFTNPNKKRPSSKKVFSSNLSYANHLEESDVEDALHVNKRKRVSGTSQHSDSLTQNNNNAPIIIYGTENTERPPLLPILPIQRLRLLREKQRVRNMRELGLIQSTEFPSITSSVILGSQSKSDEGGSYLCTSSTPSPIKNGSCTRQLAGKSGEDTNVGLPILKSLKNRSNRKRFHSQSKGTVWSANFEYDLSEYDAIQKKDNKDKEGNAGGDQKTCENRNNIKSSISNGNLATGPNLTSEIEDLRADINSNRLSNPQKNLLLKGPASTVAKTAPIQESFVPNSERSGTPTLKKNIEPKKDKESIVLPTVGFDFIKDNETPSKKTSPKATSSAGAVFKSSVEMGKTDKSTKTAEAPTLSFNFSQKANKTKAVDNTVPSTTLFNFGGKSDTVTSASQPFKFGKTSEKSENHTESDAPPKSTAPIFSFGKQEENGDEGDDENEPKRKRRLPVSEDTNTKPLFDFGKTGDQKETKKGESEKDASGKPSFVFGASNKQAEGTPLFTFGKKADVTSNIDSSAQFTFGKAATAKETHTKPSETPATIVKKPTFTFGQSTSENKISEGSAKPTFSFSKSEEERKSSPISNEAAKPSFSFPGKPVDVQAPTDDKTLKPTFSFTEPAQKDSSVVLEPKKPSFTFASSKTSQPKPLFSFGKSDAAKEPPGSNTSFSFTKPPANETDKRPTPPSFTFGGSTTNNTTTTSTKPSFSFGAPESMKSTASTAAANTEKLSNGFYFTKFNHNKEKSNSPTSLFDGSASSTPIPVLGKPTDATGNTTSKSAFSFGTANTNGTNASANSTSFSFNAPATGNGTTTTSNTSGTNIAGTFNVGKPDQSIASGNTNGAGSAFGFSSSGTAATGAASNQSSFNFGNNGAGGLNPFTSATSSTNANAGLFNKPPSTNAQNVNVPSAFNFTGNNSTPGGGSLFNMNGNTNANTVFAGSNNQPHQSQTSSFNTNSSFTPSTVPNINFSGLNGGITNTATNALRPSDIFGANAASGSNSNVTNPSSIFGGAGGVPTTSFGQPQSAPNQMGMGTNNGMSMGGGVMANRKIARMRHSKR
ncbi:CLL_HP2_G0043790.mRNA.1.CDS.1 [Saccharomyces cerevisiae]|uniref:K7_Nup1p n=1 Tax=Saccharomyces cerevisiae (strain Kyokai no. 7 / NBRC 101557) TaxID=721032 RepID=G2WMX5_YEASK|nr:K7_Nup1p [Saccharomyces cerevisiae Kyokai no. 7]CAI5321500.1 CLL_HP2_G0043790.mRNA.1.CDS.1 [Saccharomyces cerevisiae]CAI6730804.1 CLL_HP2_G0043790.mRNA.1.CDS.1 [Saccharomyces cerevisiae]CAI6778064.1 CLL_HP1_G0049460.mRNA.1.CDS.1 [Saccharomyces cerevisiae]